MNLFFAEPSRGHCSCGWSEHWYCQGSGQACGQGMEGGCAFASMSFVLCVCGCVLCVCVMSVCVFLCVYVWVWMDVHIGVSIEMALS